MRVDYGSFTMFAANIFDRCRVSDISSDKHHYMFSLKVNIINIFLPAIAPPNYNSKSATGMVGLENLGATCYLNALLQMLYHINSFRKAVYEIPFQEEELKGSTTLALQNVFKNLQYSSREVSTKDLTLAFGWTSQEAFMQQDVQEMMRVLLDKLEEKMKGTNLEGFIKDLFAGGVRSYIRCVNVPFESKREEEFYDIQLDVKGCKNIYESFNKYIEKEMLEGENQYDAGEKYGKQDAQKGVIFTKFPPVLTIHLKRFDFDMSTMGFIKIHDYYEFPTELDIESFLAPDCPPESRNEPNQYILHSVLVHAGDVGGGHYYAYIRPYTPHNYQTVYSKECSLTEQTLLQHGAADNNSNNNNNNNNNSNNRKQWYKFNDETVLEVEPREAVSHCYGRSATDFNSELFRSMSSAYMLVYMRVSQAPQIMRAINDHDIPKALMDRLNHELQKKKKEERKANYSKSYETIQYVTEYELKQFNDFSKFQDFISENYMLELSVVVKSTYLGIHLAIAQALKMSPLYIRLWKISGYQNSGSTSLKSSRNLLLRISDPVDHDMLASVCSPQEDKRFFVQYLDPPNPTVFNSFSSGFEKLQVEYSEWKKSYMRSLLEFEEIPEDESPVIGLGIGMGTKPLIPLKEYNAEAYSARIDEFLRISLKMSGLFKHFWEKLSDEDTRLVVFKVYDPTNLVQGLPACHVHPSQSSSSSSSPHEDRVEALEEGFEYDLKEEEVKFVTARRQYFMPVKYLGYSLVRASSSLEGLKGTVMNQLCNDLGVSMPEIGHMYLLGLMLEPQSLNSVFEAGKVTEDNDAVTEGKGGGEEEGVAINVESKKREAIAGEYLEVRLAAKSVYFSCVI